jgi:hypothetical protein
MKFLAKLTVNIRYPDGNGLYTRTGISRLLNGHSYSILFTTDRKVNRKVLIVGR